MIRKLNTLSNPEVAANKLIAKTVLTVQGNSLLLSGLNLPPDIGTKYLLKVFYEPTGGTVSSNLAVNASGGTSGYTASTAAVVAFSGSGSASSMLFDALGTANTKAFYCEAIISYSPINGWVVFTNAVNHNGTNKVRHTNTMFPTITTNITSINVTASTNNYKIGASIELFEYFGPLA